MSEAEAFNLTGRDCKRPLKELEENNSIRSRIINGEKVYLNRSHEKAEFQIKERKINPKFKTEDKDDEDEIGFIMFEEFSKTFNEALNEMAEPCPISNDRSQHW